jgi:polyphosphate kinase
MELEDSGKYHSMRDLMKFPPIRPELENINPEPLIHPAIDPVGSIFKVIKKQDVLLNYPFHTFKHFIDILREAAVDPRVESIYITLYRTAEHSKVINALRNAARNGKHVTALVELKARFDEEHNIDNTNELQQAGVKVIHPLESLKVHCKLLLIERREGKNGNMGYLYVGTGNFNEKTTELYCDFGLFTSNQTLVHDARKVFDFLINTHERHVYKYLLVSPHYMRREIEKMIDTEIKNAKAGKKAYFYGKFNSLTDDKMIAKLYKASNAGVKVRLIIRGACRLRSGVKGLSEKIEVRSIVDKYLEHGRMIIHCNGGNPNYYIFSADLMTRNLDRRIEVGTPILDRKIQKTLSDIFEIQWSDNVKARSLIDAENNIYVKGDGKSIRSQAVTYDYFKDDKGDTGRD